MPLTLPLSVELEPLQRRAVASVQVTPDTWWTATVTLPEDEACVAILEVVRHGHPTGADAGGTLVLPAAELPALVALVAGVCTAMRTEAPSASAAAATASASPGES